MMIPVVYRDVELGRYYVTDNAIVYEKVNEEFININNTIRINKSDGYWQIPLCTNYGTKKVYPLYRIVIGSFQGDRPDMVVDHIDMNRNHNWLSNLEYVTFDENLRRAARAYGKSYRELFTEDQVRQICELLEKGYNSRKIQRIMGLTSTDKKEQAAMDDSFMRIIYRISWKEISKDYTWDIDDVRLKVYAKEDLRLIAYLVVHSGYGPKEIAKLFPKYNLKQLNQVVKKMNQGKLYKKFLEEAGSTTIADGIDPPRDSDGFMRLVPTALGVKQLRKIRQDLDHKNKS